MAKPWVNAKKRSVDAADARIHAQAAKILRAARTVAVDAVLLEPGTYRIAPAAMVALRAALSEYERRASISDTVSILGDGDK